MKKLLQFEDALQIVVDAARERTLGTEAISLPDSLSRVLSDPVTSPIDVPPFANSAMDGFSLRAEDTSRAAEDGPVTLKVIDESRAGSPSDRTVEPGTAIRISTGAAIPGGADCVVRKEDIREKDGEVLLENAATEGQDIRGPGEDIRRGDVVLEGGIRLGPAELGVLASMGVANVSCRCRPQVNLLATGDELTMPDKELEEGRIYSSNSFSVPAQVKRAGGDCGSAVVVSDDRDATLKAVSEALDCDLLIVCGGVSVGEHDYVKSAFTGSGVEEKFWRVALKPGKPTWFGSRDKTLVVGLPGNPVSAMVVFLLLVRPALYALQAALGHDQRVPALLDGAVKKRPGRTEAVRCRLRAEDDGWHVMPAKQQGSHVLTSMLGANALALLPAESGDVEAGTRVEAIFI